MNVKKIIAERMLAPTQISIAPYTINPYRGCPLGCVYCYAQENKAIKKRNEPWGTFIDVKTNAPALLEREIKNKSIDRVLLGATVECYPPQEKDFLLSRAIIEMLNKHGIAVTILTKSCLIERDLALIAGHQGNKIYLTVSFDSEDTKKIFEPFSPPIKDRLEVLKKIQQLKINHRVHIAPVFPSIQNIETIVAMVGNSTQEISIELYNFRVGGWKKVERIIKNALPDTISQKINHVISSKERYAAYIEQTKNTIDTLRKTMEPPGQARGTLLRSRRNVGIIPPPNFICHISRLWRDPAKAKRRRDLPRANPGSPVGGMKQKIFLIAPGFQDYYRNDIRYE